MNKLRKLGPSCWAECSQRSKAETKNTCRRGAENTKFLGSTGPSDRLWFFEAKNNALDAFSQQERVKVHKQSELPSTKL